MQKITKKKSVLIRLICVFVHNLPNLFKDKSNFTSPPLEGLGEAFTLPHLQFY